MSDLTLLVFLQPYGAYNAGETAGFTPAAAERILGLQRRAITTDGGTAGAPSPIARRATEDEAKHAAEPKPPRAAPKLRRICFDFPVGPYVTGDIASFDEDTARRYAEGYKHAGGRRPPVAHYVEDPKPNEPEEVRREPAPRRRGR